MSKNIPSYRHHKPTGRAVVTLDGRDHYLGAWGSEESRCKYDRLVSEWLSNGRQSVTSGRGVALSIVELIAAYLEFASGYYVNTGETTSEYTCVRDALRPVRQLYARTAADEFGPLALKAVRQKMIDMGWSRPYINRQVVRIRRTFKWGVENELVDPSVLESLRAVAPLKKGRCEAREPEPVRPVPDENVDAVLPFVSRQVAAMIELQRLTGMRPGEVVLMRPLDIDRSGEVWVYRPLRHKMDYRDLGREVLLGPKAQEVLLPWLVRPAESFCFSPAEAEEERNQVRRAERRTPMTPSHAKRQPRRKPKRVKRNRYDVNSYRWAIKYGIRRAGCPDWHPHQLRHSCGTRIRSGFGLDVAQLVLGHASADVTQVYAEADRKRAEQVIKMVG